VHTRSRRAGNGHPQDTDGGATWRKVTSGCRRRQWAACLAISPVNPDVVYAIIEAAGDEGGFFLQRPRRVVEQNGPHTARDSTTTRIYCDPLDVNKVYSWKRFPRLRWMAQD